MSGEPSGAIVFPDIVGFTELTDVHGDGAALGLIELQDGIVHEELPVTARVIKELGDGLLIWFDHADVAIGTALRLQQRFASHGEDPTPLWVRMGVHWGRPLRRGDDIIGRDVNLASRIAGLASAGEVLCSGTVVDAAGAVPDATFCSLGSVFVKGVADPIPLFRADITSRTP